MTPPDSNLSAAEAADRRVYRGRSIAEILPKIHADLGAEAIVTGRRNGLEGGVAGFFQRPFVELEAQPGAPQLDICDGEAALPPMFTTSDHEPFVSELSPEQGSSAPQGNNGQACENGFASALAAASELEDGLSNGAEPVEAPAASAAIANGGAVTHESADRERSRSEAMLAEELQATGFDEEFAWFVIETANAHVLPFAPRIGLRRAVRIALQRALPQAPPLPAAGAAIVFVGPGGAGKSTCARALSSAYRRRASSSVTDASILTDGDGVLRVSVPPHVAAPVEASSKQATSALTVARAQGMTVIDTPTVSVAEGSAIRGLARVLGSLAPERVVLAVPATLSASATSRLMKALAPLKPNALAITHAEESEQLGVAVQAACACGLAPEYLLSGTGAKALTRLHPTTLVEGLIP